MSNGSPDPAVVGEEIGGAVVQQVLQATSKTLLALGEYGGRTVVVKALRTDEYFWQAKFGHEVGLYQAFQATPPPVRVPRLLHTDGHTVLVIEHIPGRPVDNERYPETPPPTGVVDTVLTTVSAFHQWQPPAGTLAAVFDYPDRIARYHHAGFFDGPDRAALEALLEAAGPVDQPNHGDPLPANLLITGHDECVLIDWEFTGLFLPGFDLAMLHTLLAAVPGAQDRIEAVVTASDIEVPFLVNRAMVLSRELRMHAELPAGDLRERRLALLRPQWSAFRACLHAQR
ncbi:MAG: phosphotransferase [Nocardiopsaceae bacterium]|nr:phosphotransferase [Nocardiopsaceae bacterium]